MTSGNIFEDNLNQVSDSIEEREIVRNKHIEVLLEISELKRIESNKQRELSEYEIQLDKLKSMNGDLRASLMKALIEKEELDIKKKLLINNIERLERERENLDRECNSFLNNDALSQFFDRHSTANQLSLISRIHDKKCKLIKYSSLSKGAL